MYRSKTTPFAITIPNAREPISGVVTTAMALGALVQLKSGTQETRELIACNGGKPAILENQVMADADWQAHNKLDPQWSIELRKPVPVGSAVTARFAHEAEFEGAAYFNGITANTAADTPLKVVAGKLTAAVLTVSGDGGTVDVPVAYLRRLVTPVDPANFRWVVEFVG